MKGLFKKLSILLAMGSMVFGSELVKTSNDSFNHNEAVVRAEAAENSYFTVTANTTANAANNFTIRWTSADYKVTLQPTKDDCGVSIGAVANYEFLELNDELVNVNIITGAEAERVVSIVLHTVSGDFKVSMTISGGIYSSYLVESVTCNHSIEPEAPAPEENNYFDIKDANTGGAANNFKIYWTSANYAITEAPVDSDFILEGTGFVRLEYANLNADHLHFNLITGADSNRSVSVSVSTASGRFKITLKITSGNYKSYYVEKLEDIVITDEEKIANVVEKINAIGTVEYTNACKALIDAARLAYDGLDDSLKASVSNYETLTAAEAEYIRLGSIILVDSSKTKVIGAGVEVYFVPAPNITLDDINITIVSYTSNDFPGVATQVMNTAPKKIEYATGRLYFTIAAGVNDGCDAKMVVNISFEHAGGSFNENLTFIGNVYQRPLTDEEKIAKVEETISAIGTVEFTNASKTKIEEARAAYDELDDSLKESVSNYDVLTAAEAEYERLSNETELVKKGIVIDASQTKVEGAGVMIYLADKPAISMDDISVTILSYTSVEHAGVANKVMNGTPEKKEYIQATGKFYFTIAAGVPNGCDAVMVVNISYDFDGAQYSQNVTFVGNAYQSNPFPTISNTDALTASAGTNYFLRGNVKNVTNTTTGEFSFYDADGVYVNVLSSGLLGSTYENMSEKLADGDDVVVYGTVSNVDGVATMANATIVSVNGLVLEETFKLAADVIKADTCKDYANAEDYQTRYDALSADNQAIFASITVNCKVNEDDADLSGSVNLLDKLTYMGQLNNINNVSFETTLNNLVDSKNVNLVLVIGLLGLISVAGYYFINKKRFAK